MYGAISYPQWQPREAWKSSLLQAETLQQGLRRHSGTKKKVWVGNNAVWPTLSACEHPPVGDVPPPKGFSSLVYLTVANTKPHAPYVKQDFSEFLTVIFCLPQKINSTAPWFSPVTDRLHWTMISSANEVKTEGSNSSHKDSLKGRGSLHLVLVVVGLGDILGSKPDPVVTCCVRPWASYLAILGLRSGSKNHITHIMSQWRLYVIIHAKWRLSIALSSETT